MSRTVTVKCDHCGREVTTDGSGRDVLAEWMQLDIHMKRDYCVCFSAFDLCPDCVAANPALAGFYDRSYPPVEEVPVTPYEEAGGC